MPSKLLLVLFLLVPGSLYAQTLVERFEASAMRQRPTAIAQLERRVEDRKSLYEAAKRGPINRPENGYSSSTTPDGQVLHNFSFRSAADRKEVSGRYQKQLANATRDLKEVKSGIAWACLAKSIRELEVGDFVHLQGEFRILFKESNTAAWIERANDDADCFYLTGADFSRYADGKAIDFRDAGNERLFWVKGTRQRPDSLRTSFSSGQTFYELEMLTAKDLQDRLPQGVRIAIIHTVTPDDEVDLPTPEAVRKP